MCIIALKPRGEWIGKKKIINMFKNNPDGAGYMYRTANGDIVARKPYYTVSEFLSDYYNDVNEKLEAAMHFRIKTAGQISKVNTHPHNIGNGAWMMHNGHITFMEQFESKLSDTARLARALRQLRHGWWKVEECVDWVDMSISTNNKILIMTPGKTESCILFNSSRREWHAGCWYSNTTWQPSFEKWDWTTGYYGTQRAIPQRAQFSHAGTYSGAWDESDWQAAIPEQQVIAECRMCGNEIKEEDLDFDSCAMCGHDITDCTIAIYEKGVENGQIVESAILDDDDMGSDILVDAVGCVVKDEEK